MIYGAPFDLEALKATLLDENGEVKASEGDRKQSYKCSQNIFKTALLFNPDPTEPCHKFFQ